MKLILPTILIGHNIGLGLTGSKQNVFIDVFKRFGVTAYGINKAIELAR